MFSIAKVNTPSPSKPFAGWRARLAIFAAIIPLCATPSLRAEETDIEQAAAALLKATVTVRILPARVARSTDVASKPAATNKPGQAGKPEQAGKPGPLSANQSESARSSDETTAKASARPPRPQTGATYNLNAVSPQELATAAAAEEPAGVLVGSGVSLGAGLVLTFCQNNRGPSNDADAAAAPTDSTGAQASFRFNAAHADATEYRVTLPDGEQSQAEPRVVDQYSGLVLLEIKQRSLPGLKLASELPRIGGAVLSASAAGIERPLVSLGVLSGVERTVPGASLPPMLQCDISTTEASSGAALVDRHQQLIGVIAATDTGSQNFGWSFAIPVQHIRRVVEAQRPGELVVLARQRAIVGLKLGPGPQEGTVQVEHVAPGGPADQAGIRQGEMVLEADGRKLRSAYQAVALILKRLPGDEITLVVGTEKASRSVRVKLGGGAPLPTPSTAPPPGEEGRYQIGAQVEVNVVGPNRYEVRNGQRVKELNIGGAAGEVQRLPANETELLQRQLQAYQDLIIVLQKERLDRQNQEQEQAKTLQSLREEIGALKKKLEGEK